MLQLTDDDRKERSYFLLCSNQLLEKRVQSLFFYVTEYTGKYVYKNGNLEFFNHPEGIVEKEADGYKYVYQFKDHLDNVRLSYRDADYTTLISNTTFDTGVDNWQGQSATLIQESGRLKVTASNRWNGVQKYFDVVIGDVVNYSLLLDKGSTERLALVIYEHDSNGKLKTTVINDDANGLISGSYSVSVGTKIRIKIEKVLASDNGIPTHFYLEDVYVTKGELTIVQEKNYYPFGLTHKGYNTAVNGRNHNYGFGNKEEQDEIGLGWIDITARNYDPALGRWMNLDPLAEDMTRHSPYNYAFDNPVYYIDPDGMSPFDNYKIYSDGSILRQKTDDATDTFTYVDEGGTSHEIGTYDKNDSGLIKLEDINYSMGDTEVKVSTKPGNGYRSYVSGSAMASLIGASADSGEEIYVVSASKSDGSSPPPSVSHKNGKNLDIRYAGKDGSRDAINYKNSKTNFDKIDQSASSTMNASLKKFGWKDIKSSKLTVTNTTTITGADGKEVTNTTSNTYSVSGTKHLKNHYDHEHLQGYKPNVTTRTLQTPINLQSLPPVRLFN